MRRTVQGCLGFLVAFATVTASCTRSRGLAAGRRPIHAGPMAEPRRRNLYAIWEPDLRTRLREARRCAPELIEVCGLIVDVGPCLRLSPTRNVSRRRGSYVACSPDAGRIVRGADAIGGEVIGSYHSHPLGDPEPSRGDIDGTINRSLMLILQGFRRSARLWWIQDGRERRVQYETVRPNRPTNAPRLIGAGPAYDDYDPARRL